MRRSKGKARVPGCARDIEVAGEYGGAVAREHIHGYRVQVMGRASGSMTTRKWSSVLLLAEMTESFRTESPGVSYARYRFAVRGLPV